MTEPTKEKARFILGPEAVRAFIDHQRTDDYGKTPDEFPEGAFIAIATMDAPFGEEGEVEDFEIIGINGDVLDSDGYDSEFMSPFQGEVVMSGAEYRNDEVHVLFRVDEDGDVTAVFPFLAGSPNMCACYAHVGQHSSCDIGWVAETRAATDEEAAPLRKELEQAPFNYKFIVLSDLTALSMEEPQPESPKI
jgi:hypothetical protein